MSNKHSLSKSHYLDPQALTSDTAQRTSGKVHFFELHLSQSGLKAKASNRRHFLSVPKQSNDF
jgi:hypothetical protein